MDYNFTNHADQQFKKFGRSQIKIDWIEKTLNNPDYKEIYEELDKTYHWKCISEYGNRALKVVFNHTQTPVKIITFYFDRNYKK